jgi:hypothetical protein
MVIVLALWIDYGLKVKRLSFCAEKSYGWRCCSLIKYKKPPCITNASLSLFNLNIIIPLSCLVAKTLILGKLPRSKIDHVSYAKFAQQCAWKCPICKWSCPHNLIQLCLGVHGKSHMTCSHDPTKYIYLRCLCGWFTRKKIPLKNNTWFLATNKYVFIITTY